MGNRVSVEDVILGVGGILVALMSLVQLAPVKINPWSALAKALGRAINADLMQELAATKTALEKHIQMDDERNADAHRAKILAFNTELLRGIGHTREDFIEILAEIDCYENYCRSHPEYKNNRAKHAIANIGRVYDDRLKKHDFLGEMYPPEA